MVVFSILLAYVGGLGLGLVYFGGLWLTLRRLRTVSWPAALALGSFWIRLVGCTLGLYFLTGGHPADLGGCLLGFLSMRGVLVRRWGPERSTVPASAP